jgi:hypothetical protein
MIKQYGDTMSELLKENALKVYDAIFEDKESVEIDGEKYFVERTSHTGLRSVVTDEYFYVEQNPEKSSTWAKKAREGHKILWVIQGSDYVAQVTNGKFIRLKK